MHNTMVSKDGEWSVNRKGNRKKEVRLRHIYWRSLLRRHVRDAVKHITEICCSSPPQSIPPGLAPHDNAIQSTLHRKRSPSSKCATKTLLLRCTCLTISLEKDLFCSKRGDMEPQELLLLADDLTLSRLLVAGLRVVVIMYNKKVNDVCT